MQIYLRRQQRCMPQQVGDLVQTAARIGEVAGKRMSQLVRSHCRRNPRPASGRGDQGVDRIRRHRSPDRLAEQVHEHEVVVRGPRNTEAFELVGVKSLHQQEIQRNHPRPTGFRPRPVRIIPAHHVQMRPLDRASQKTSIRQQMHIAAMQPAQLSAPQPRPNHQQHDQPVPRRPARQQQRDNVLLARPVHRRLRLVQPVPGPHPPRHTAVLAPRLRGKVTVIGNLVEQWHHPRRCPPRRHSVPREPAHRRQDSVDPPSPTHRLPTRPGQHIAARDDIDTADLTPRVAQPNDEQPQMLQPGMPMPSGPAAPAQEQRDPARIGPRRQLRTIATEAHMTQERVRIGHHRQVLVEHGPIHRPRRQPHRKRTHSHHSDLVTGTLNNYQPRGPHTRRSVAKPGRVADYATSRNNRPNP